MSITVEVDAIFLDQDPRWLQRGGIAINVTGQRYAAVNFKRTGRCEDEAETLLIADQAMDYDIGLPSALFNQCVVVRIDHHLFHIVEAVLTNNRFAGKRAIVARRTGR